MIDIAAIVELVLAETGTTIVVRAEGDKVTYEVPVGTSFGDVRNLEAAFQRALGTVRAAAAAADADRWIETQKQTATVSYGGVTYRTDDATLLELVGASLAGGKSSHAILDSSRVSHDLNARQVSDLISAITDRRSSLLRQYSTLRRG